MYILHWTVLLVTHSLTKKNLQSLRDCCQLIENKGLYQPNNAKMLSPFGFGLHYFAWQNMVIDFDPNQNDFVFAFAISEGNCGTYISGCN